ncbi:hypothetical protein TWF106_006508 [Orbilia oligospora]|uniref:Mediator of RNA polymerase II transcription subunit 22 n=1 Tax=Orbilia oligospora TaxID=2813651 RepID=A0A7C8UG31_ORBOL|nr:hypothetical protein TWF106_006508 [Orbilia oligospora]
MMIDLNHSTSQPPPPPSPRLSSRYGLTTKYTPRRYCKGIKGLDRATMENPTYTAPSQSAAGISKLNGYQNTLILKFQNIIELATEDTADLTMAATQTHQIQVHTAAMIKTVEDLLTLTRALKEAWLFGQMGEDVADQNGESSTGVSTNGNEQIDEDAKFVVEWLRTKLREGNVTDDIGDGSDGK